MVGPEEVERLGSQSVRHSFGGFVPMNRIAAVNDGGRVKGEDGHRYTSTPH